MALHFEFQIDAIKPDPTTQPSSTPLPSFEPSDNDLVKTLQGASKNLPLNTTTSDDPWSKAYFGYTGIMGKDLTGMSLATAITYDNQELQIHESEWKHSMHKWKVDKRKTIHVGCRTFNASSRRDFPPSTQVTIRKFPEQKPEPMTGRRHCASDVCWFNFTIIQSVSVVCLGITGRGDRALSFKFGLDISQEKTSTTAMSVPITMSPQQNFEK